MPTGMVTAAAGLSAHLLGTVMTKHWLRRYVEQCNKEAADTSFRPGVTVLKPLCGADDDLEANLESFMRLTYPYVQIIFGAADADESSLTIARRVAARFPKRDVEFVVTEPDQTSNPKVANLAGMLPHARYDLCLISDSDVAVRPDELEHLVPPLRDPKVGLVYQPVIGEGEQTLPAAVENCKLTDTAGYFLIFTRALTGRDLVMGKGMLLRRQALESIGGFEAVRKVAAEDYILGVELRKAGWKLVMSPRPVRAVHTHWSWPRLFNRTFRHSAMRCRLSPWTYPIELICNPVFLTLLGVIVAGRRWLPMFLLSVAGRMTVQTIASKRLRGHWPSLRYLLVMPFTDILLGMMWLPAIFGRTVTWRGHTMRLGWQTRLTSLEPTLKPSKSYTLVRQP